MAFQQVGVEAVIAGLGTFRSGGREMNDLLRQMGMAAEGAGRKASGLSAVLGPVGTFIGRVGTIIAGILGARLIENLAQSFASLGREMLTSAINLQALEVRLKGIVARQIAAANSNDVFLATIGKSIGLTATQERQLTGLRNTYDSLTVEINRLAEAGKKGTAYFQYLEGRADVIRGRIETLVQSTGEGTGAITRMAAGALSMGEALQMAVGPARDLLDWIVLLSTKTPFPVETVANTFTLGTAMGFTTDEMKRLAPNILNFVSFMGLGADVTDRVIYNFGQMRAAGKVTGTELRDLARGAMFPVNDILRRMQENLGMTGMSFDDFKKRAGAGRVPVEAFFEAFQQIAEEDFAGAAERLSRTILGLQNRFVALKQILGRELFGPILDVISGPLSRAMDALLSGQNIKNLGQLGALLGTQFLVVARAVRDELLPAIGNLFEALGIHLPTVEDIRDVFADLTANALEKITELSNWINTELIPALNRLKDWVNDHKLEILALFFGLAATATILGIQSLAKSIFTLAVNLAILGISALPVLGLAAALTLLFLAFERFGGPAITAAQQLIFIMGFTIWQTLFRAGVAAQQLLVIVGYELNKFFTVTLPGWLASLREWGNRIAAAVTVWVQKNFIDKITGFIGQANTAGRRIVEGLIAGVRALGTNLTGALKKIVQDAIAAVRRLLGLDSPSRLFFEIGLQTMAGFTKGILDSVAAPVAAAEGAGQAVAAGAVAGARGDTYEYNFNVSANYAKTQLPITIAQDLTALIGMART